VPLNQIQEHGAYIEIREKCEHEEGDVEVLSEIPAMNEKAVKTGCSKQRKTGP
jgi:hypothetical protein